MAIGPMTNGNKPLCAMECAIEVLTDPTSFVTTLEDVPDHVTHASIVSHNHLNL